VGRIQELALLRDRWEVVQTGEGQVVSLVGAPGMGKTRLLTEFGNRLAPGQVPWYCGHCLAYGQAISYLPVRDLLRQLCTLVEGDHAAAQMAAVQHRLLAHGICAAEDAALMGQLLELPVAPEHLAQWSPETRQARTFALLGHLIRSEAQQTPLVLVVEDVHWIDPTSAAWLGSLVERLAGTAVLLLVTARPGYQPLWGIHARVTQLALPPLGAKESQAIVVSVPGTAQLPAARCQQIVAHGAGNPFFVEELAWHAVEAGLAATPIPATVHAVLAARLDRLLPEAKYLVQHAAVIGTEVPVRLLQRLAGLAEDSLQRGLAHLRDTEVLSETRLFPEPVYTFMHALMHEVAYGSLLLERRRGLHARIVEALEMLAEEQVAEEASEAKDLHVGGQDPDQIERLAHHALRGEVWDKAVSYCQQVGARAFDRAAFREAVTAFEQALQALTHLPEHGDSRRLDLELRLSLGGALYALGEYGRCLTLLGEAEVVARVLEDQARLGQVLARRSRVLRMTGDYDGAIASGQEVRMLAAALGDSTLQEEASYTLGLVYYASGDFGQATALLRQNVEAADRESGTSAIDARIRSQAWLALTLSTLGAFAESRHHGEEALRLATLTGHGNTPIIVHGCLGLLYLAQGDLEHASQIFNQGLALCQASGNRDWLTGIVAGLGYAAVLQGHLAEGHALLEEAIRVAIRTGGVLGQAFRVAWLSEVCRLAGRGEAAWQYAHQALDLARQLKECGNEALALHQLGVVHAHTSLLHAEQAQAHYQQALELAEALGMRPLVAHCHLGLGRLYGQTGREAQSRTALTTAIDLYRAMDMTFWLPQAEATLAQLKAR
jgi:tetratricopeptide (TPR) repeat protein